MLLPHGTTIVVTDGQKLELFRNTGTELHLVGELAKEHTHDTMHYLEQALKDG
jgi:protein required for attachment to host cells